MLKKYVVIMTLVIALALPCHAWADEEVLRNLNAAKITLMQAVDTAQKHKNGSRAISASLDDNAFAVGVIDLQNEKWNIRVNASDGTIISSSQETGF